MIYTFLPKTSTPIELKEFGIFFLWLRVKSTLIKIVKTSLDIFFKRKWFKTTTFIKLSKVHRVFFLKNVVQNYPQCSKKGFKSVIPVKSH